MAVAETVAFAKLAIKDAKGLLAWSHSLDDLNSEAGDLMEQAGEALEDIKENSDGEIIDIICDTGKGIISGVSQISNGLKDIRDGLETVVNTVDTVSDEIVSGVKGIINGIGSWL